MARDRQEATSQQLPFIFGSANYLEDAAGGLAHPDWSEASPQQSPTEEASSASPPSEQYEVRNEAQPGQQTADVASDNDAPSGQIDSMLDFRSMLDSALQGRPG